MIDLVDLDERTRLAAAHWNLTLIEHLAGGSSSAVYAATDDRGRDLVLKLPTSRFIPADLTAAEAAALRAWADTGAAVTLVDATPEALLLGRARPGTKLPWRLVGPASDLVEIAAEVLGRLWAVEPLGFRFPAQVDVYPERERVARQDARYERRVRGEPDRGAAGLGRLQAAAAAAARLMTTVPAPRLLHGDFITKNLVSDHRSVVGWVALDPLPVIGDPASEVAAFAAYQPAELILSIAETLAVSVNVPVRRALAWAAVCAVHQATQAWRDDQESLDRLVESEQINRLLRS